MLKHQNVFWRLQVPHQYSSENRTRTFTMLRKVKVIWLIPKNILQGKFSRVQRVLDPHSKYLVRINLQLISSYKSTSLAMNCAIVSN